MKNHLFLLAAIVIALVSSSITSYADSKDKKPSTTHKPIVVVTDTPNLHRDLSYPVVAYYSYESVNLTFEENFGQAVVTVHNLSMGASVTEYVETSQGDVIIDISNILTIGEYVMTIYTSSGNVYRADFYLE